MAEEEERRIAIRSGKENREKTKAELVALV